MQNLPYALPDAALIHSPGDYHSMVWIPQHTVIVLGQSNKAEQSLNMQAVESDGIMVTKRPSGGESVILSPDTIVISVVFKAGGFENPSVYFRTMNQRIISVLLQAGLQEVHQKGISDLSIGMKKILGSSIYRRQDKVLYHAVLNYAENPQRMERYLAHPQKEPDYRNGRSHQEFVTSLKEQGCRLSIAELRSALEAAFAVPV